MRSSVPPTWSTARHCAGCYELAVIVVGSLPMLKLIVRR